MDEQRTVSEAQKRAHRKYMEKFVEIKVRVTPEKRTTIQEHAQVMGESATTFINRAIDHQISQDRDRDSSEAREGPPGAGVVLFSLPCEAYKRAVEASEATGEAVPAFIDRAVTTQAQRDETARKLGGAHGN